MKSPRLLDLTWPEVEEAISACTPIVIPVGSIEQHGPHLPIGTDSYLMDELALRMAAIRPLLLAPTMVYTCYSGGSGGGRQFPGSFGVPLAALQGTLTGFIRELIHKGFRHLVVLNGHWENTSAITESIEGCLDEVAITGKVLQVNWWELVEDQDLSQVFPGRFPGWEREHASVIETSLMEVLRPELVRNELKSDGGAERVVNYGIYPLPREVIPANGIYSTAVPASPAIGEAIMNLVLVNLGRAMDAEFGAVPDPKHQVFES